MDEQHISSDKRTKVSGQTRRARKNGSHTSSSGVWMGIAPLEDRMKAVEKILGIPEHLRAFALFPYGYPAEERKQQNRYDESRIHYV